MCKMMILRTKEPMTNVERKAHKEWQWGNRDGVGTYTDSNGLHRYPMTIEFTGIKEYYKLMIYHARNATTGRGTHPLISEDGRYYLIHNGWFINLQNWYALREDLKDRGHKFQTEIDSEILLHLFEECKKSKKHPIKTLIKRLGLWTVNGKLNFIVYDSKSDKFYIYSDGDLEYIYTPDWMIWVATEFQTWADDGIKNIARPLPEQSYLITRHLRVIEKGTVESYIGQSHVKYLTDNDTKPRKPGSKSKDKNLTLNHYRIAKSGYWLSNNQKRKWK